MSLTPATILPANEAMPEQDRSSSKEYQRAFSLAAYILKDASEAEEIARLVAHTHDKELKKHVKNRNSKKHPNSTRVLRNPEFNLDIYTYIKIARQERKQEREYWERRRMLGDEDMIIRFIKQLVCDGLVHNSRFLNVGLAHLLFSYSYDNVAAIQLLLEQSPANLPAGYRYRKHRQTLVDRLRARFNGKAPRERQFLKFKPFKQHKEAALVSRVDSAGYYTLVRQCLKTFTPAAPPCPEPLYTLDPRTEVIEPFHHDPQSKGGADKHAVERNRMHAVVCPDCFSRILSALNFVNPESSLRLPLFSLPGGGGGKSLRPGPTRGQPGQTGGPSAVPEQRAEAAAKRSENSVPNQIVISVDDQPQALIDINNPQPVGLMLEPGAAIIEALAGEGQQQMPLGLIYLDWDPACDEESPAQYKLKLNEDCTLEFLICYATDEDGDEESATVKVNCVMARSVTAATAGRARKLATHG